MNGMKVAGIKSESICANEVSSADLIREERLAGPVLSARVWLATKGATKTMISRTLMAASTRPIILAILSRGEDYGYSLIQKVKEFSGGNIDWTEGMIYPVLQRMEVDGLISSKWKISADERPRRYFRITERGQAQLASELAGWGNVWKALNHFAQPLRAED